MGAPCATESLDSQDLPAWFNLLDVKVSRENARVAADVFIFAHKSSCFPQTGVIPPLTMAILLFLQCLCRFELQASALRTKRGLKDRDDKFCVLKCFEQVAKEAFETVAPL